MSNPRLSIIIPSYNESAQVKQKAVEEVENFVRSLDFPCEVIIVDDESTNNTLELVKKLVKSKESFRLIENRHGGKAMTVMSGLLQSKGEVALFTDMDQATPIQEVLKFIPKFNEGFDIVIGSRQGRKGAPLMRKLAGWGFSVLRNISLGLPFKDTQCGFKAFSRESTELIFPDLLNKWRRMKAKGAAVNAGFDVEVLFLAKKRGLKVAEVDVEWRHVENVKQVQLVRDSIEAIKDMLRIRWNDLTQQY